MTDETYRYLIYNRENVHTRPPRTSAERPSDASIAAADYAARIRTTSDARNNGGEDSVEEVLNLNSNVTEYSVTSRESPTFTTADYGRIESRHGQVFFSGSIEGVVYNNIALRGISREDLRELTEQVQFDNRVSENEELRIQNLVRRGAREATSDYER